MILWITTLISFLLYISFYFLNPNNNNSKNNINLLGGNCLFILGLILLWVLGGAPTSLLSIAWFNSPLQEFSASIILDSNSIIFIGVGLLVTWSIIEFSHYYMSEDYNKQTFMSILILFLFFMLILVLANSLFLLFIGWEGVGILSFILIGWWFTRNDANSAALQAIIYNRIGDSGIILFIALSIIYNNTWSLTTIFFLPANETTLSWMTTGLILAGMGKSAQFILHPWLPSAMEGPTPVSALLHSSTMVVAGVFLLLRTFPIISQTTLGALSLSLIGAITALYAGSVALVQFDIKKVIAYSTTSQLGLMVAAIGLGAPNLALFHICTHAFFKALLFLCSGSIIHSLNNDQDLRKMGNISNALPFTSSAIIIGSVALCGAPFMAGFYSKDLILETSQISIANSISVILALAATLMTALYSMRIIYYLNIFNPNNAPTSPLSEENPNLTNPLIRLILGAFVAGWLLLSLVLNYEPSLVPLINKSAALILLVISILFLINNLNSPFNKNTFNFLNSTWFYTHLAHPLSLNLLINNSIVGVLRSLDYGWVSHLGAQGAAALTTAIATRLQSSLTATVTHYIFYFMGSLSLILTLNLLN
uniref:NADH dehydrogenase subunit 5 n=1 Tax=Ophioleila elegans TaxID=1815333 RepID=UPI0023F3EB4C|nr:NADH dehydrogenase subunit 5 [Ophioleila elegans]WED07071.1 NADH dehydrogenase subunit 5 [Ophioleila elegans]